MQPNFLLQIIILIFSVIIHEVCHGLMALSFGDKTAEYEGRLTLNPIKHIDYIGSIFLPLFLFIIGSPFMIGWAKPVPYNPYNLRNRKIAEPLVAFAGPLSNITIALIFGLLIRTLLPANLISAQLAMIFGYVALINISLAIFNLIPIPPLDGSKILFSFLPIRSRFIFSDIAARYGFIAIIALMFYLPNIISPIILSIFSAFTGLH
jgi:Zn-dependent protease